MLAMDNDTVLDAGWDGEWFLRAYDALRTVKWVLTECEEGKILYRATGLLSVMAGIGTKGRQLSFTALDSVEGTSRYQIRHCTAAASLITNTM